MLWVSLITVAITIILGCIFSSSNKRSECALGICGIVAGVIGGICIIIYITLNMNTLQ